MMKLLVEIKNRIYRIKQSGTNVEIEIFEGLLYIFNVSGQWVPLIDVWLDEKLK